ncbi:heat shock factor protein 5 [Melanotaenia boesemani]|uniref:heat shock factor protein 5 n=1 Tax=Melanotaenia boesemani TaxID=1250792 RepID=UPI001C05B878|nr:heat shock factor protein 5 [Melanotaenia boesemani]XP_041864467.1 heat shock factor protein 5 [Melanotaenia boesemani]
MDGSEKSLPDTINPNNFPAKLWLLVNNPTIKAIDWDSRGEAIVIDQKLFEKQILSPNSVNSNETFFKTTNFSSFVRQLNLYGFRKGELAMSDETAVYSGTFHYFYNPNFQRDHPELVSSLRRLTVDNKAKIKAGLEVNCRLQNHYQKLHGGGDTKDLKRRSTSPLNPTHQDSPHPCHPNKFHVTKVHSGTPVPPQHLSRGHGAALSPNIFPAAKGIPASLSQYYTVAATTSNVMHIQQGLPTHSSNGNPNFTSFNSPTTPHQPGYYPSVCRCCHPNLVSPHIVGLQKGWFSPQSFYQGGYPVKLFEDNQELQREENQEGKKRDINLDAIFQIADEVMQTSSNTCLVKVETPEKKVPVFGIASNSSNAAVFENSGRNTKPVQVLSSCPVTTQSQEVESVTSELYEVTTDQVNDEIISVEISYNGSDTSQD